MTRFLLQSPWVHLERTHAFTDEKRDDVEVEQVKCGKQKGSETLF